MSRAKPNRPAALIESLEPRCLMSVTVPGTPGLDLVIEAAAAKAKLTVHAIAPPSLVGKLATAPSITESTIPANGDENPYGAAFVPAGFPAGGPLAAGDLLVSNFNNSTNAQGSGTTIDNVTSAGTVSTFFQGPPGLGLTTALAVLKKGFVVVGSLPTTDGASATASQGSLTILDKFGLQAAQFSNAMVLDGPWDMTVNDQGAHVQLFISNVLSGTIERIDLLVKAPDSIMVENVVQIASGYEHRSDPSALELGPTGLAFNAANGTLYVASTADNEIFAIAGAAHLTTDLGTGRVAVNDAAHLHGPLGLALESNGDLLVADGDAIDADPTQPSELVEFSPAGTFINEFSIDANVDGPFGVAIQALNGKVHVAAVDDNTNTVTIWTV